MSDSSNISKGYCQCGCGEKTTLARSTDTNKGYVKGEPHRFCLGHYNRKDDLSNSYAIEDRGYDTQCWIWQRYTNPAGYGKLARDGEQRAHRVFYKMTKGEIPEGAKIDHLCQQTQCVNPQHLEATSHATNVQRGRSAKLTGEKAAEIRRLYATGSYSYNGIAEVFGVDKSTISQIIKDKIWRAG